MLGDGTHDGIGKAEFCKFHCILYWNSSAVSCTSVAGKEVLLEKEVGAGTESSTKGVSITE
jgi:hypothetical protein